MEALIPLFWVFGGALGALIIGVIYFVRADTAAPLLRRALASAYAPSTVILFAFAVLGSAEGWRSMGRNSFVLAQLAVIPLLIYSLVAYPGNRATHFVLLPLALLCWYWQVGMGTMFIFGK